MKKKETIFAILILFLAGVTYRFFPHPPNFTPVAAIALFSGFFFRRYFISLPIVIMFISDMFIGFYDWKLMIGVYSSFVMIIFLGMFLRESRSIISIITFSLFGSVLFFVLSNLAVWIFSNWYTHDLSGLSSCYAMAFPFFKNTLAGDLFYVSVIFGCYEILAQPKERLLFIFLKSKNKLEC